MSKPKRIPIGTSEILLKGVILLSICSHSSGMKGVMTHRRSGDGVALLSVMGSGAAEGTNMFTFLARDLGATGDAVPGIAVAFARSANSRARGLLSEQMGGRPVCIARGHAVFAWVIFGTVAAENTTPSSEVV